MKIPCFPSRPKTLSYIVFVSHVNLYSKNVPEDDNDCKRFQGMIFVFGGVRITQRTSGNNSNNKNRSKDVSPSDPWHQKRKQITIRPRQRPEKLHASLSLSSLFLLFWRHRKTRRGSFSTWMPRRCVWSANYGLYSWDLNFSVSWFQPLYFFYTLFLLLAFSFSLSIPSTSSFWSRKTNHKYPDGSKEMCVCCCLSVQEEM